MDEPTDHTYRTSEYLARAVHDHVRSAQLMLSTDEIMRRRYIAVRLEDAHCDGIIYDTRDDALRNQKSDPNQYAYVQVPLERWGPASCDVLLWYWRTVYKNQGYRPAGHHAGPELILPVMREDLGI